MVIFNVNIPRTPELRQIQESLSSNPVTALLGSRQCGKTTLARQYLETLPEKPAHWFDLEDPEDLSRMEHPKLTLENLEELVVIDEIQRRPDLFPVLRVLIDQKNTAIPDFRKRLAGFDPAKLGNAGRTHQLY